MNIEGSVTEQVFKQLLIRELAARFDPSDSPKPSSVPRLLDKCKEGYQGSGRKAICILM